MPSDNSSNPLIRLKHKVVFHSSKKKIQIFHQKKHKRMQNQSSLHFLDDYNASRAENNGSVKQYPRLERSDSTKWTTVLTLDEKKSIIFKSLSLLTTFLSKRTMIKSFKNSTLLPNLEQIFFLRTNFKIFLVKEIASMSRVS